MEDQNQGPWNGRQMFVPAAVQTARHFSTQSIGKTSLQSVKPFHTAKAIILPGKPGFPTVKPFPKENPLLTTLKPLPFHKAVFTASTTPSPPGKRLSSQENDFPKTKFTS